MIVSSWNVNSVRARIDNIKEYLKKFSPDIVIMQEIKTEDINFPYDEFKTLKYESHVFGQKSYNGVAIISKNKLQNIRTDLIKDRLKQSRIISGEITYKKKNISDILDFTVSEALDFFKNIPTIKRKLQLLDEVGLSYIKLGQNATTLSGGEAQRIKLARELIKRDTGKTLYVLDEPTTGLHFYDVEKLLMVLHRLRDKGNSLIVIEHNLDVIKTADWVIDLGPEGGDDGGLIIATGTPDDIVKNKNSHTGIFLKNKLKGSH